MHNYVSTSLKIAHRLHESLIARQLLRSLPVHPPEADYKASLTFSIWSAICSCCTSNDVPRPRKISETTKSPAFPPKSIPMTHILATVTKSRLALMIVYVGYAYYIWSKPILSEKSCIFIQDHLNWKLYSIVTSIASIGKRLLIWDLC